MDFIHHSKLKFHGNLKPSTCLVDSRLQIKLSGFGLWEFKYGGKNKLSLMESPDYKGKTDLNSDLKYDRKTNLCIVLKIIGLFLRSVLDSP